MIDQEGYIDARKIAELMDSYKHVNGKKGNKSNNGIRLQLVNAAGKRINEWGHDVLDEAIVFAFAVRYYVNNDMESKVEEDVCTAYTGQCSQCGSCGFL